MRSLDAPCGWPSGKGPFFLHPSPDGVKVGKSGWKIYFAPLKMRLPRVFHSFRTLSCLLKSCVKGANGRRNTLRQSYDSKPTYTTYGKSG